MPAAGSITSTFFNNYGNSREQGLIEDLIIESISIYGLDFYYLPKTYNNIDDILGQDDVSSFDAACQVAMYVTTPYGFGGEGDIMSKFGLEIRDRISFTISARIFDIQIGVPHSLIRPREGDLVYYPLNRKLFQIMHVDNKPIHYPLGSLPTFELSCELIEYSNEQFNTGVPEIDIIQKTLSTNIYDYAVLNDEGKALMTDDGRIIVTDKYDLDVIDPTEINTEVKIVAGDLIDFSESNPFAEDWEDNL